MGTPEKRGPGEGQGKETVGIIPSTEKESGLKSGFGAEGSVWAQEAGKEGGVASRGKGFPPPQEKGRIKGNLRCVSTCWGS